MFKLLPEVLEGQFGYKLFICGRDDYAGEGMEILLVNLAAEFQFLGLAPLDVSEDFKEFL